MPTINLENLIRYDSKAKNEAEEEYLPKDSGNWQKTEEAGAVAFYPVPNTPLEGKVKFSFAETPPASGDKGPENPSTVMGVSSVNVGRVGKNLLLKVASTQTVGTVAMTPQSDGSYIINGTTSGNINIAITDCGPEFGVPVYSSVRLNVNKNYTLTATILEGSISGTINVAFGYGSESEQYVAFYFINGVASYTFNSSYFPDGHFIARIRAMAGASFSNAKIVFQLEEGDTTTAFEAPMLPADANHDIPLGDTYYGGTLDVASGVMTVTWESDVFTSIYSYAETLSNTVKVFLRTTKRNLGGFGASYNTCNKIPTITDSSDMEHIRTSGSNGSFDVALWLNKSRLDISSAVNPSSPTSSEWVDAVNAWLADNPLLFVYELSTPYTIQLTPPQILALPQPDKCIPRLNTVYTDADTIQIGYMKSPQRTEQEIAQALLELESDDSD